MFGFFSMSASKISAAISTLSKYLIMKLSGEGYNREKNNVFLDESNNYFGPITANGNVTQGTLNPLSTNVSWFFDGSGDYLSIPANTAFQFGTENFTIEFWQNYSSLTNFQTIISSGYVGGLTAGGWAVQTGNGDGKINFSYIGSSSTTVIASESGTTPVVGQWYHIAIVKNGTTVTIYRNGVNVGSGSTGNDYIANAQVFVGGGANTGFNNYWVNGYISNLRIVKGTAVYVSTFVPPSNNLTAIANTSLLTCQNTYLVDNSSNSFALTINGDAQSRHFGPFDVPTTTEITKLPSRSVYFDGTGDYLTVPANTALNLFGGSFTIETWIYPVSFDANSYNYILVQDDGGSNSQNFALRISSTGAPFFIYFTTSNRANVIVITSTALLQLNTWSHLAVVYNSATTTVTLYLNGNAVASSANAPWAGANIQTCIGNFSTGVNQTATFAKLNAYLSNLRMVKGTAVYTSAFTPSTSELTAISNTSLLTCQGAAIADSSTNNFTITTVGDARVTANSPFSLTSTTTTITPVTQSWSGYFDGTGDMLTISSLTGPGTGNFTYECWVYPTSSAVSYRMIFGIDNYAGGQPFRLYQYGTNFQFWYTGSAGNFINSNTITINQWYHLAVTRESGNIKLFVNGIQSGSTVASSLNYPSSIFRIGQDPGALYPFIGYISNVRAINGTALYTSTFTPPTSTLTAISGTSLLTCQSPRFIDNSATNATITVAADAKTTMFGPFLSTGSMLFNGSAYLTIPANAAFTLGTGDYTIEAWIYPTTITGTFVSMIVGTYANLNPGDFGWGLVLSTTGKLQFFSYGTTSGTGINIIETGTRVANMWQHVAVTRSGTSVNLWVNGVSVATTTSSKNEDFSRSLKIGTQEALNLSPTLGDSRVTFKGNISNLRVVKGTAVYTSAFTPPTANLTNIANTSALIVGQNNFNDTSSNAFTVTNSATAIQTENNGLPRSPYASNYSVSLSSNAYLVAPSGASTFGTGDFTVECWIYPTTVATNQMIASNSTGNTDNNYWAVYLKTDRTIEVQIRDNASNPTANTLSTVTLNSWTHIAVVRNSGNVTIYTNGIPGAATSIPKTVTARTTNIGSFLYTGFEGYFTGYISNLRIVTGTAVYRSSFTPPTSPLTAISGTTLLTCQSNRFIDNSSNAYAITVSGSPSIVNSFTPYDNLYSWYFDGTGDYVAVNHSSAINILSGDFTVECWFNSEVVSGIRLLMGQWNQTSGSEGWMLRLESNNTLTFTHAGATPGLTAILTSPVVNMGTWNHVAVTRTGSALTMWLNGVSVATAISSTTKAYLSINTTFGIYYAAGGTVPASGLAYYKGWISNARILKGVSLYNSAFTPSVAPLSTYATNTGLLTANTNTIADGSGNLLNITTFGDTRVNPFTPFSFTSTDVTTTTSGSLLNGTAYFDGTGDFLSVPANDAFIPVANEDFTIDFWWRPTSIASVMAVLSSGWGTITYGAFVVYFDNTNSRLVLYASSANAAWDIANAAIIASNVKPNVWYHIAISRRAGSLRLFSNGVLTTTIASSTAGMYRTVLYPMLVGAGPGGVNPLNGYVSNLRILRGAGLYSNSFASPTTPTTTLASSALTLNFRNAGIYDSIGDNIFETIGDSALSTVQKKNGNSSMYFDGTGDYLTAVNPNLAWGTGDFTVEFWMYSADVSGAAQRGPLQTSTTAGGLVASYTTGIAIVQGSNRVFGALTGGLVVVVAGTNVGSNSAVLTANTWAHVAIVRSSGTATLYINGTSVDSRTASGSITATNIAIGGYYSTAYLYSGYLDDLQVNNYAKYTANFTPT